MSVRCSNGESSGNGIAVGAHEGFAFCFTLDTESDDLWAGNDRLSFDHMEHLPAFHKLLVDAGARPTYLTTSEVAEDGTGAKAMFKIMDHGRCEIGAHFHTWTRQWPFGADNIIRGAMAHALGQQTEERMLRFTVETLRSVFGVEAKSYRGGRWSFNDLTPVSLANCGIEVDSTITPGLSWRTDGASSTSGPDWTDKPCEPEVVNVASTDSNSHPVVLLPVGSATRFPRVSKVLSEKLIPGRIMRRLARTLGCLVGFAWLRPTHISVPLMRQVMKRLKATGCPVWVIMIHSSEIIPCTPLPTKSDVDRFIRRCVDVTGEARALGAVPMTLEEAGRWILSRD